MCTEICHSDRTVRTGLLALLTSDASNLAGFCDCLSFGMGAAAYKSFLLIWCKLDQMMRAFCNTFTTGFTFVTVNHCHTVNNMDRTNGHAFTQLPNPMHP